MYAVAICVQPINGYNLEIIYLMKECPRWKSQLEGSGAVVLINIIWPGTGSDGSVMDGNIVTGHNAAYFDQNISK